MYSLDQKQKRERAEHLCYCTIRRYLMRFHEPASLVMLVRKNFSGG